MSFFNSILSGAASLLGGGSGKSSIGADLAKTALLAYANRQINKSLSKENESLTQTQPYKSRVDQGVRLQVNPSSDEKIPVCYGRSTLGGIIVDARLSTNQKEMFYVLAISERTGTLLSSSSASAYVFNDVFINDTRIIFKSDGITCDYTIDRDGNKDFSARDVVQVYCFAGDSETPQVPEYYSNGSLQPAYVVVPGWTSYHMMEDLIFAVVKITYSPESGLTNVPDVMFNISNSMTRPGDVMYDYMTNTRYGCGIAAADIST
jgi:hypothetical protein